jgi:hypothetical protein
MSFPALLEMPKMLSAAKKKGSADESLGAAFCILNLLDVEVIFCRFEKM